MCFKRKRQVFGGRGSRDRLCRARYSFVEACIRRISRVILFGQGCGQPLNAMLNLTRWDMACAANVTVAVALAGKVGVMEMSIWLTSEVLNQKSSSTSTYRICVWPFRGRLDTVAAPTRSLLKRPSDLSDLNIKWFV